jgi:hypothetical protein
MWNCCREIKQQHCWWRLKAIKRSYGCWSDRSSCSCNTILREIVNKCFTFSSSFFSKLSLCEKSIAWDCICKCCKLSLPCDRLTEVTPKYLLSCTIITQKCGFDWYYHESWRRQRRVLPGPHGQKWQKHIAHLWIKRTWPRSQIEWFYQPTIRYSREESVILSSRRTNIIEEYRPFGNFWWTRWPSWKLLRKWNQRKETDPSAFIWKWRPRTRWFNLPKMQARIQKRFPSILMKN